MLWHILPVPRPKLGILQQLRNRLRHGVRQALGFQRGPQHRPLVNQCRGERIADLARGPRIQRPHQPGRIVAHRVKVHLGLLEPKTDGLNVILAQRRRLVRDFAQHLLRALNDHLGVGMLQVVRLIRASLGTAPLACLCLFRLERLCLLPCFDARRPVDHQSLSFVLLCYAPRSCLFRRLLQPRVGRVHVRLTLQVVGNLQLALCGYFQSRHSSSIDHSPPADLGQVRIGQFRRRDDASTIHAHDAVRNLVAVDSAK